MNCYLMPSLNKKNHSNISSLLCDSESSIGGSRQDIITTNPYTQHCGPSSMPMIQSSCNPSIYERLGYIIQSLKENHNNLYILTLNSKLHKILDSSFSISKQILCNNYMQFCQQFCSNYDGFETFLYVQCVIVRFLELRCMLIRYFIFTREQHNLSFSIYNLALHHNKYNRGSKLFKYEKRHFKSENNDSF